VLFRSYGILVEGGWFILEFPNKIHGLMTMRKWMGGNLQYRSNMRSIDRRELFNRSSQIIPFMNHHPDQVQKWLREAGFEVKECFSVSNLRRIRGLPMEMRLKFDKLMWGLVGPVWWGPSIFVLVQK